MKRAGTPCTRCGGQVMRQHRDEPAACVQCGYSPPGQQEEPAPVVKDSPLQVECLAWLREHEGWTNTPDVEVDGTVRAKARALGRLSKRGIVEVRTYWKRNRRYRQWRAL